MGISIAKDNKEKKYKVFIVDDHPLVRSGLTDLINRQKDLAVCGEAEDVSGALKAVEESRPDILIADLSLGLDSGLRLMENLKCMHSKLPVLVLSMHDESLYAERCFKAGARGYIMKEEKPGAVISAIRNVLGGELHISDKLGKKILNKLVSNKFESSGTPVDVLSNRELEVYNLLGKGLDKHKIAKQLFLSIKTVETYMEHVKKKMNFKDSRELMMNAVQWVSKL